jgi:hypothetical protein
MITAAKVMVTADTILDPELLRRATAELVERTGGKLYVWPLPIGIKPPKGSSRG